MDTLLENNVSWVQYNAASDRMLLFQYFCIADVEANFSFAEYTSRYSALICPRRGHLSPNFGGNETTVERVLRMLIRYMTE